MSLTQITPYELQTLLQTQPNAILLDVREDVETQICQLSGSLHIPMNLIPLRHNELPDDVPIVVYCHHGIRSLNVARYLAHLGFDELYNLSGGIDAWAQDIAPEMARY
ncbi:MAG: rhodanese-like domain-containing protein [Alysiella sp.]|uniref:rhodanese-like domain-containing protein n=1 Tax=Alysiella sp. TaxID=1872483 RepID=UPI0026DB9661|nr:rhodanese-like domain-containing protein [Alysiella sp.]MDO4434202.1 rhodanese-like domain-containing protein [Alysiella sp.]